MDELKDNTIDTSVDHYEITGIEPDTKKVLVNFAFSGYGLHHSFFVDDVKNKDEILSKLSQEYANYKLAITASQVHTEPLPSDVADLIGDKVDLA